MPAQQHERISEDNESLKEFIRILSHQDCEFPEESSRKKQILKQFHKILHHQDFKSKPMTNK